MLPSASIRSVIRSVASAIPLAVLVASPARPARAQSASASATGAPGPTMASRRRVVDSIVGQLRRRYVMPDSVERVVDALTARLHAGAYDSLTTGPRFAAALAADLYAASHDGHLSVRYDPPFERRLSVAGFADAATRRDPTPTVEEIERQRLANFGVPEAHVLEGNVGYLRLTQWVDLTYSRPTLAAALALLGNVDALIVDVAGNPGGYRNAVDFVTSHLVGPPRVELMTDVWRDPRERRRFFTDPRLGRTRLATVPVFIATDGGSGSGSEVLAFQLRALARARTVGTRTAGAGYGNLEVPVGDGLVLYLSTFRHEDPTTHAGFQGVGVPADVAADAAHGVARAHAEAIRAVAATTGDSVRHRALAWMLPSLDAAAHALVPLPDSLAQALTGRYAGSVTIGVDRGRLTFTGVSGVTQPLVPLGAGTFEIADPATPIAQRIRVEFDHGSEGTARGLWLLVADGRRIPRARVP